MGYQESWVYIEPQWNFKNLIRAYEQAEAAGNDGIKRLHHIALAPRGRMQFVADFGAAGAGIDAVETHRTQQCRRFPLLDHPRE